MPVKVRLREPCLGAKRPCSSELSGYTAHRARRLRGCCSALGRHRRVCLASTMWELSGLWAAICASGGSGARNPSRVAATPLRACLVKAPSGRPLAVVLSGVNSSVQFRVKLGSVSSRSAPLQRGGARANPLRCVCPMRSASRQRAPAEPASSARLFFCCRGSRWYAPHGHGRRFMDGTGRSPSTREGARAILRSIGWSATALVPTGVC